MNLHIPKWILMSICDLVEEETWIAWLDERPMSWLYTSKLTMEYIYTHHSVS